MQNAKQRYRLRAPGSGREAIAEASGDGVYVDRESGEEMEVVSRTLPLAPSESALIRAPENLRAELSQRLAYAAEKNLPAYPKRRSVLPV